MPINFRSAVRLLGQYWIHGIFILTACVSVLFLMFLAAILVVESRYASCQELRDRAADPATQEILESWVDENWTGENVPDKDVAPVDGIVPGARWLTARFDGSVLQMNDRAHVRLVTRHVNLSDPYGRNVDAISFAERSRFAVLVLVSGKRWTEYSGLSPYHVTDRIAVMCDE